MANAELLKILCCPETRQALAPAPPALLERLNREIASGKIKNRAGHVLSDKLESGLLRADGKYLYPVRHDLPILLMDEAIPLAGPS